MRILISFLLFFSVFSSFSQSKKELQSKLLKVRDSLESRLKVQNQLYNSKIDSLNLIISVQNGKIERLENKFRQTEEVIMGGQIWMKYNLDIVTFRNGDTIPQAQTDQDWEMAGFNKQPAWCYYVNEDRNLERRYGKLYNRYAINDPRGLAPEGWHISTGNEWEDLQNYLLTTDYYFEDIFFGKNTKTIDRGEFGKKCLKIGFGGWRDVGCGGLDEDAYYWLHNNGQSEENSRVFIGSKETQSRENDYLRNRKENLFIFDSTSWIMGHYVRCVKD